MRQTLRFLALVALISAICVGAPSAALAQVDTRVSAGGPSTPYPRNDDNEPALAVDPINPQVLAAGANTNIDGEPCTGNSCPFTLGVGNPAVYFSLDGGASWVQPTYTGWSARTGAAQLGPIGTLPWYYESGLEACCDPALAFGPVPGPHGLFSWANGSRLYYANLAFNFSLERKAEVFKGPSAIFVSRTDDPETAALGGSAGQAAWMRPVQVSNRQSRTSFGDKEQIWADNAESSRHFGNVYVCWASFRSKGKSGFADPLMISRSTDGGTTWSPPKQITAAANNSNPKKITGRQGCAIRTDSAGTVYVFYSGGDRGQAAHFMARSFDGGVSFERPRPVASPIFQVGAFDVFESFEFFDGVRGSKTNSYSSVDIANGAPSGADATDQIVLTWSDARCAVAPTPPPPFTPCVNSEAALVQYSLDLGQTWSAPVDATALGDRADFPAIAISPDGKDVYLTYDGFLDPYRSTTSEPRRVQGVVRHADVAPDGSLVSWQTLHRGAVGDARASSRVGDNMRFEFIGDYNYAVATREFGSSVWADLRNAEVCPTINIWRQLLLTTDPLNPPPAPAPPTDCPPAFGNTDIFGISIADPTP